MGYSSKNALDGKSAGKLARRPILRRLTHKTNIIFIAAGMKKVAGTHGVRSSNFFQTNPYNFPEIQPVVASRNVGCTLRLPNSCT